MEQKEIKIKIQALVDKYERVKSSGQIKKYTEEETKKDFILPLFGYLGWDIYNKNEVTAEESISKDRVDYGFYFNNRIKFYLEAKSLKTDLHKEEFAKQAIQYSWNKGVTWAILTDFESLIVFNALSPEKSLHGKKYFEIPYNELLERFDQLWLLSREAFSEDLLDKEAEKHGKKLQKVTVTETLAKDLNLCRKKLSESFITWNEHVNVHLIDEGVQKLLDRLIFIRVAEDRGIEPQTLIPLIREWQSGGYKGSPYQAMIKKFRELDKIYNSNLFVEHPFEKWEEYGGATEEVVDILHGKKNYFEYDFSVIPADVLGSVYESYLGFKLERSKDLEDDEKVKKNKLKKRKEQGIYYTPKFIVDYIVENSLGTVLDKCKNINDLQKIKVLDPACGSGSFLVTAFNLFLKKYEEFKVPINAYLKVQILQNNIYGVDLDEQAVELARLNLFLNTFDSQLKLPNLGNNIKNGNSLISGSDEELEKYFGKNYRDKKPFNWQEEFPEVFKQGGFDVVIGNPPYLDSEEMVKTQNDFRNYSNNIYRSASGNWDLFCIFIERGLDLLNKNGYLGFIVPNKLLSANYAEATRKIVENNNIILVRDFSNIPVFKVGVYPIVIVLKKEFTSSNKIKVINNNSPLDLSPEDGLISQQKLSEYKGGWSPLFNNQVSVNFIEKILTGKDKIGAKFKVCGAATVGEAYEIKKIVKEYKEESNFFKFINTGTVDRYNSNWGSKPTRYIKNIYTKPIVLSNDLKNLYSKRFDDSQTEKLIIAGMTKKLEAFLDLRGEYLAGKSTTIIKGKLGDLKYLLGLINSKLMTYIYTYIFKSLSMQGGYLRVGAPQIKSLPLPNKKVSKVYIQLIDKIINLNQRLFNTSENSNEWQKLSEEITKVDKKIDEEVYKLYGLNDKDIEIVEKNHS